MRAETKAALDRVRANLKRWCDEASPEGECYSASLALVLLLAKSETYGQLVQGIADGRRHWWVVCENEILDPFGDSEGGYEETARHSIDAEAVVSLMS